MDALMKIAVILSAYDKMTSVVDNATSNAQKKLAQLAKNSFVEGAGLTAAGIGIVKSMQPAVEAYSKLEDANIDLKASMLESSGAIDANFQKISGLAEQLGDKLPGTTADFYTLFQTMMNNGVKSQNILNGVGQAAAYLAVDLKMPYAAAGEFAARMKEATGVADEEMEKFLDTVSRANSLGVNASEMQYAFSRSAGSLKLLGLQGLKASKDMTVLYASLIRAGQTGETSASSFNSIVQNLLDKKKFSKFSDMAKELGISFNFFKDGKFLGVENMVAQFDKMKNLGTTKKAELVQALTGGGQDGQALNTLIQNGVAGYQKMRAEMEKKASLNDKVNLKLKTLSSIWESTTGTIENMLAALGAGLAPILKPLADLIGRGAAKLKEWLTQNPALAKFVSLAISLVGIAVALAGVIKIFQGIRIVMQLLNVTMRQNPFILFATIAILVISYIYANWGKISAWFSRLWQKVKQIFSAVWNWIKNMFLNYTPQGLIIKHWDKIAAFFTGLWQKIKSIFINHVKWVFNLGSTFFNAGKNIIMSIWNGIKALVNKPIEAIKSMVGKIRRYLPFSPAKEGPLTDIHKIRLVETIAEGIKPAPILNKMRSVLKVAYDAMVKPAGTQVRGHSTNGINFNITINLSSGANKADASMIAGEIKKQFSQLMKQYQQQQVRVNF